MNAIEVSWFWDWVPPAGRDAAQQSAWTATVAELLENWAGEKVAAARAAWPADAEEEFPFTVGQMGDEVARGLLARADDLPGHCRLAWGAAFLDQQVRWVPLIAKVEFHQALPEDPSYLMAVVGAEGQPGDIREPNVDYISTDHGDGVRVLALARSEAEGLFARVDAALRLEDRTPGRPPAPEIDVLVSTQVTGFDQMAVIGDGIDVLMTMIATQFADQLSGEPGLRFDLAGL